MVKHPLCNAQFHTTHRKLARVEHLRTLLMNSLVSFAKNKVKIQDVPSVQEYRKLRRVMGMITKFYRDGSEGKKSVSKFFLSSHCENWETVSSEIKKLEVDENMVRDQLAAMEKPIYIVSNSSSSLIKRVIPSDVSTKGNWILNSRICSNKRSIC